MSESSGVGQSGAGKPPRASGGRHSLRSFQSATIVHDATVAFCERFASEPARGRLLQGARSGRQSIAEASRAAATSRQTELRLIKAAHASLDDLLAGYEEFLRGSGLPQWEKDNPQAEAVRAVGRRQAEQSDPTDRSACSRWLQHDDPETRANAIICLILETNVLLDRQIAGLQAQADRLTA